MKTAISIPDALYGRVQARIARSGVSRSAFFAQAAERYLDLLDEDGLTEQINAVVLELGEDARDPAVTGFNASRLAPADEGW